MIAEKEKFIVKPKSHGCLCGFAIGLICVVLAIFLAVCTTYFVVGYVPAFSQPCPSEASESSGESKTEGDGSKTATTQTPPTKSTIGGSAELQSTSRLTDGPATSTKIPIPKSTSMPFIDEKFVDSTSRFSNLLQNYNLVKCSHDVEESGQKWVSDSQNSFNQYLKDEDKTLQCNNFTTVPHEALQKALDSYRLLRNSCEIEESVDETLNMKMKFEMTLESAVSLRQRVLECVEKPLCLPSGLIITLSILKAGVKQETLNKFAAGKTIDLVYHNKFRGLSYQAATGKPNPRIRQVSLPSYESYQSSNFEYQRTCRINGTLYASGVGWDSNEFWKLPEGKNEWTKLANLPSGRRGHCMVCLGDTVYVLGGNFASIRFGHYNAQRSRIVNIDAVLSYDINTNNWTEVSQLQYHADYPFCAAYNQNIFVFEHRPAESGSRVPMKIQIYYADANEFKALTKEMPVGNFYEVAVWKSKALIFGSHEAPAIFDLELETWDTEDESDVAPSSRSGKNKRDAAVTIDGDTLYSVEKITEQFGIKSYEIKSIPVASLVNDSQLKEAWKIVTKVDSRLEIERVSAMYMRPCEDI